MPVTKRKMVITSATICQGSNTNIYIGTPPKDQLYSPAMGSKPSLSAAEYHLAEDCQGNKKHDKPKNLGSICKVAAEKGHGSVAAAAGNGDDDEAGQGDAYQGLAYDQAGSKEGAAAHAAI